MSTDTQRRARRGPARVRASGDVRPRDVGIALVLSALVVAVFVVEQADPISAAYPLTRAWWALPLALCATAPLAWWRSHRLAAPLVSPGALAVHLAAVGPATRCGWGIPLAFVLAVLSGRAARRRDAIVGLVVALATQVLTLVRDLPAGPDLIPLAVAVTVVMWGVGLLLGSRARAAAALRERTVEPARLREQRAELDVGADRQRLSRELEAMLPARLDALTRLAGRPSTGPDAARETLARIEVDGRATLADMRNVVSRLRGADGPLAPTPTIAHLDALLATHAGADGRLVVRGDPRLLAPALELTAYRIVEHLVTALSEEPAAPIEVTLAFAEREPGADEAGRSEGVAPARLRRRDAGG